VCTELKKNGVDVQCRFSAYQGDLSRLAESEVTGDWDGILSMGGDGTLFEVINGMMQGNPEMPIPLGVIPYGSGNSFCMDLGVRSLSDAIKNIIGGKRRRVDLGQCDCNGNRFYFINILGFGFVSDVVARALRYKRWRDASYVLGVFQAVRQMQWYPMTFEIDGRRFHRENVFVEICNSTKTGGDMLMAPGARIDDGVLDVVLLNRISPPRILACLPKIYKGSHVNMPEVDMFSGKQMVFRPSSSKLLSPDGELYGSTPIRVSVLPARVCFFSS
jgi:YegS/Rv2252/BmrU family lipid kinase